MKLNVEDGGALVPPNVKPAMIINQSYMSCFLEHILISSSHRGRIQNRYTKNT